jgi:hypothetical protein
MYPKTQVSHDPEEIPCFEPGYPIRATGEFREIPLNSLRFHK